jgi:hypothetical protein
LPSKVLKGASFLISSSGRPDFLNSSAASSMDLPFINASVCAKKFESSLG